MSVFQTNLIITLISLCSITMWNTRLEFSQPSDPTSLSACHAEAHAHDLGGLCSDFNDLSPATAARLATILP